MGDGSLADALAPEEWGPDLEVEESRDEGDPERWRVTDQRRADWAMERVRQLRAEIAENELRAGEQRDRIERWLERVNSTANRQAEFFEGLLMEWHAAELGRDPKRKTIHLPAGTLKARARQNSWEIDDEAALLAFLQANAPELVRTKHEVAKGDMKKRYSGNAAGHVITPDGEVVPGVRIEPGGVSFSVVVAEDVGE